MPSIRACDEVRFHDRDDYSVETVFPCVTAPLTVAVLVLSYVWYKLYMEWNQTHELVRKSIVGIMTIDTIFGVMCWIQCLTFISEGGSYGGVPACELMAWYTGFYLYSWVPCVALLAKVTGEVYAEADAVEPMTNTLTVEDSSKKPITVRTYLGCFILLAMIWGSFVGAWPLLGIVNEGYISPTAYCVVDLQNPALGAWYVTLYIIMAATLIFYLRNLFSRHWVFKAIAAQALIMEFMPFLIGIAGIVGYNGTDDDCGEKPFGIGKGVAWGILAWSQHMNQLLTPIFFGMYWKQEMNALLTKENTAAVV